LLSGSPYTSFNIRHTSEPDIDDRHVSGENAGAIIPDRNGIVELNLQKAGISTVIYATGFHRNFSWIDLPVFDETGYPGYQRGITDLPGLYFIGLH